MGKFLTRLRESVTASAEPQLQRGGSAPDEEDRERLAESSPTQAERDSAAKSGDAFSDGSFPITTQKQAQSAWELRGHNENHSEASIVAHIRKQVAKHGLTMPSNKTQESAAPEAIALGLILLREARVEKKGDAYEVTVVREGPGNQSHKNYYTKQALREAVKGGLFEGLQAYLNHPTPTEERERPERDVRYLAGHFREARYVDGNPAEVRAKFIPGGMDKEGVVSLIESALQSPKDKPLIGISIDGYGATDPHPQEVNGRTYNMVREVTHLGSADIVTRAGAGGQFHRRLQEAWRDTGTAERRPETSKEANMNPAQLQEKAKAALAKLTEASALKDDDAKAGTLIEEGITALRECADATIETPAPEVKVEIREVEKPVAAGDSKADELAAELETTKTKLTEAETARDAAKSDAKTAADELGTVKSGLLARKVMREAKVPTNSAESWFDQVVAAGDETAMKTFVTRKLAERAELLAELQNELGTVEGAGARQPLRETATAGAQASGGLLGAMGINPDDLAA